MNKTPRYYAELIIEWVERQIDQKVPADFRALVRATVAAEMAKPLKDRE